MWLCAISALMCASTHAAQQLALQCLHELLLLLLPAGHQV
jgi:hypothetical protein